MKRIIFLIVVFIRSINSLHAQNDIVNIVPLSPNSASISRLAEVPISNFTGIPNISIPIYAAKSGKLELPLNLNYHAGGVRVESIASWVGLSWSLSGMPSISRSVRGAPDDNANGYFNFRRSVRDYISHYEGGYDSLAEELLDYVRYEGEDTEPDVFQFNVGNKSGRFFFNQDHQKFFADPYSNIKIEYLGGNFRITDDDGTKYLFAESETTSTSGSTAGSSVKSSWMITEIVSADLKDSISFIYSTENQISSSLIAQTKYVPLINSYCVTLPDLVTGGQLTSIAAKTPLAIICKNARIDFVKNISQREDLVGGYALDKILIKDRQLNVIKQFSFNYRYLTGSSGVSCFSDDPYRSNKWMLLSKVSEISTDGADTLKHTFVYNESYVPPCRNSAAQDYWGYYNGANSNVNLLPTVRIPTTLPPIYTDGADRSVNPAFTQFGILKQINYPSGGYAKFEYENNDTKESQMPKMYKTEVAYVAQELPVDDNNPLPTINEYQTTFVIDNPPDLFLNANEGGAMVSGQIENLGVPFGSSGAQISITRILPAPSSLITYVSGNFSNYYLPNGTYVLKASFNQNPANYQDFSAVLTYKSIDSAYSNGFLGGLRVKSVEILESPTASPLKKAYSYVEEYGSNHSSGHSFLKPTFKYAYALIIGSGNCAVTALKIRSFSNQAQVTNSGSYVGYGKVFVTTDDPSGSGMSSYTYSFTPDLAGDQEVWPFPPGQSMENFRGQLLEQKDFKFSLDGLIPVKSSSFIYHGEVDTTSFYAIKTSSEQFEHTPSDTGWPKFVPYEFSLGWSALAKQTERIYDQSDTTRYAETVTEHFYDVPYRQLKETTKINSKGELLKTKFYHPYDLSLSGEPESARLWFLSKNSLSTVLKTETILQDKLVAGTITNYKKIDGLNLVRPSETISYQESLADGRITHFDKYDNYGNLTEMHTDNGPKTVYLWSYGGNYPLAELKNVDYSTVAGVLGGQTVVDNIAMNYPTSTQFANYYDILKNSTLLKDAQVSFFAHKPLVGLSAQIDPKGMFSYYSYDNFGRLATVKDHFQYLVKSYSYHYKTSGSSVMYYNSAVSQVFSRNNCPSGYVGGQVTYTVPAQTYSSSTSQAAADALAMNDISVNGQNYANINGACNATQTCTMFKVTIPANSGSNIYVRYKECGSNSYILMPLDEFPQDEGGDAVVGTIICVNGTAADFTFQYGLNGAAQIFFGTVVENLGNCF